MQTHNTQAWPIALLLLHCLQASICTELIKRLLQYGPALTAASTAVAELDCLCSLAAAARELGYCRPQLVTDSVIHIEGGGHMAIDDSRSTAVARQDGRCRRNAHATRGSCLQLQGTTIFTYPPPLGNSHLWQNAA